MKDAIQEFLTENPELSEEEKPLYRYSCAEQMILAANKKYNLNLNQQTINAIIPFGGEQGCRRTCGYFRRFGVGGVLWGAPKPLIIQAACLFVPNTPNGSSTRSAWIVLYHADAC